MFVMGDVAGGSAIVPRRKGGPAHTIFRLRAEELPTLLHRSILGERMLPNKVASARGIHAMPAGVVGVGAYTLHSLSLEILARTCWGRGYPDTTQGRLLLGRVGKGEGCSPVGHHSASSRTDSDIFSKICKKWILF